MVRAPDGHAPISAYRAPVDIFVEIGGIMFLTPPAPCNGIAVPVAAPDVWGNVLEPVSGRDPGTEPHYLNVKVQVSRDGLCTGALRGQHA